MIIIKVGLEESLSSDDSILDYLEEVKPSKLHKDTAPLHSNAHPLSQVNNGRQVRSNGNYECYHSCKDKTQCRHLCCKEGIPGKYIKEKGTSSTKPASKVDEFRKPLVSKSVNIVPHTEKLHHFTSAAKRLKQ